jgi:hypothetical protein
VDAACTKVACAVADAVAAEGPNIELNRDPNHGLPAFILRA